MTCGDKIKNVIDVILGIIEKTPPHSLKNIAKIQFYYRYFYSRTKIVLFILRLRKRVLSMSYVRKTKTTRTGVIFS